MTIKAAGGGRGTYTRSRTCAVCLESKPVDSFARPSAHADSVNEINRRSKICNGCNIAIEVGRSRTFPSEGSKHLSKTLRECRHCGVQKVLEAFAVVNRSNLKMGRETICYDCSRAANREKDRVNMRSSGRSLVSKEDFEDMLSAQENLCAVCGGERFKVTERDLHVDHDHETGMVRGLLCSNCNIGLGHFQDSPDILLSAATYLIQHSTSE